MNNKERGSRRLTYGGIAAVGALGAGAVLAAVVNSGEQQYCLSPVADSPAYSGDKTPGVTEKYATWKYGVAAFVLNAPDASNVAGYEGMVVNFKNPENPNAKWHPSDPIGKENAAENVIQVGVGRGIVQFEVAFLGEEGSDACTITPDVKWTEPTPLKDLIGTKPQWTGNTPPITPSLPPGQPQVSPS